MWLYLCRVAMIILQLHGLVLNYLYKWCLNKTNFSFLSFTSWMFHSERSVCILLLIESNFICNCTHNLIWYFWCFICILYTSINICRFLLADSLVKKNANAVFGTVHMLEKPYFSEMINSASSWEIHLIWILLRILTLSWRWILKMSSWIYPKNRNLLDIVWCVRFVKVWKN